MKYLFVFTLLVACGCQSSRTFLFHNHELQENGIRTVVVTPKGTQGSCSVEGVHVFRAHEPNKGLNFFIISIPQEMEVRTSALVIGEQENRRLRAFLNPEPVPAEHEFWFEISLADDLIKDSYVLVQIKSGAEIVTYRFNLSDYGIAGEVNNLF